MKSNSVMVTKKAKKGQYIWCSRTSSEDVFQTSWLFWSYVFKTSWRRFQDIFEASLRHLQDVLPRRLEDFFKRSSRRVAKMSARHLQDVFKAYHLLLLARLRNLFNTFLRRSGKAIIYRKICLGHTSKKFMVRVQNFQEWTIWIYRNF